MLVPAALLLSLLPLYQCKQHIFEVNKDERTFIGPIGDPFGFLRDGEISLKVFDYDLSYEKGKKSSEQATTTESEHLYAGFALERFDTEADFGRFEESLLEHQEDYYHGKIRLPAHPADCAFLKNHTKLHSRHNIALSFNLDTTSTSTNNEPLEMSHKFSKDEEGLYFLVYQVCLDSTSNSISIDAGATIRSHFNLKLSMHNIDTNGRLSYLTAGDMPLPQMYLLVSIIYIACAFVWVRFVRASTQVKNIHHVMTMLVMFKIVTLLSESFRLHYIRLTGSSNLWSTVYYTFAFFKGIMLFVVVILIGSGWSYMKPFLNDKEKKTIGIVLLLQIIDNIAVIGITHHMSGEKSFYKWQSALHLIDIICCCAVLVPIVSHVHDLEQQLGMYDDESVLLEDDDDDNNNGSSSSKEMDESQKRRTLEKLKIFRSFYLAVIGYIYFTRICVYLFSSILEFHNTWMKEAVVELGTLLFYVYTGYKFRPSSSGSGTSTGATYVELRKLEEEPADPDTRSKVIQKGSQHADV